MSFPRAAGQAGLSCNGDPYEAASSPEAVGEVVGRVGLVVVDAHGAVALVVFDARAVGAVDGDLVVVGSQPVAVGVRVREKATLQTDRQTDAGVKSAAMSNGLTRAHSALNCPIRQETRTEAQIRDRNKSDFYFAYVTIYMANGHKYTLLLYVCMYICIGIRMCPSFET